MPDLLIDRVGVGAGRLVKNLVTIAERTSIHFAEAAVTVCEPVGNTIAARIGLTKIRFVMNVADGFLFLPKEAEDGSREVSIVYHVMITNSYDLRPVLRVVASLPKRSKNFQLTVFAKVEMLHELKEMGGTLGLGHFVIFRGVIRMEEVARKIRPADIGVVLVAQSYYAKFALPTKPLQHARVGNTTVVARFETITAYSSKEMVQAYEASDEEDLAEKLLELIASNERRESVAYTLKGFSTAHSWRKEGPTCLGILSRLKDG
ncbi:MAG: hypothetical protein WBG50_24650 [Desulfomonilaceae bacterium]